MSELSHRFDDAMISGYLDGELTQGDEQRVRVHLESCADCAELAGELRRLKEATMNTEFQVPDDTQWDETPRGAVSAFLTSFGWLIAAIWVGGTLAYLGWQLATADESVRFEGILGFGFVLAICLVILSALIDRMQTRKNDPYRKVQK